MITQFPFIQCFFFYYTIKEKLTLRELFPLRFRMGQVRFSNSGKTTNYITETDLKAREVK